MFRDAVGQLREVAQIFEWLALLEKLVIAKGEDNPSDTLNTKEDKNEPR